MTQGMNVFITHTGFEAFDGTNYTEKAVRALEQIAVPALRTIFRHTVEGWAHRPDFDFDIRVVSGDAVLTVFPSGPNADLYLLVSSGSPAHKISPRRGGFLRFQPGYRASTQPNSLSSQSNTRSGDDVFSRGVNHPGFKGRRFFQQVRELYAPVFRADMNDAVFGK